MKTIGKLAKELDINIETIRFYEKKGLISQPLKPENGYRLYSTAVADKLRFIAKAKALGFTLNEISSLISMENNCVQVESLGLQKLDIIRNKISDLQRLERVISEMTNSCKANQDHSCCPIIDSLK
ncbi:MerR family DNA-binding transcriptional regulator [Cognaticolwellia beringensis]|uniref:MerR family transcriptional regulator n=1 Tax=Cognaticolwellia beringensis TaxID=1967665 RepID=A0A222G8E0_9GAMM|nr:MerR family DNA-binding transcriptional regulator [Cognaticolwellia beringensis]ASP48157.1 MerR family transcriptional regulator [Cognaticolwellia beringensis]